MSDYIEREMAKLRIFEYGVKHRDNANIASACENLERQINSIPAADVRPVVLCKECKYRNTDKYGSWCLNDYENNLKDDDFCSRGKRK